MKEPIPGGVMPTEAYLRRYHDEAFPAGVEVPYPFQVTCWYDKAGRNFGLSGHPADKALGCSSSEHKTYADLVEAAARPI